jgi:predicted PurR-regulated permease PerM
MKKATQQKIDFFVVMGIFLLLAATLLFPYLKLLALAGVLAVIFLPLHKYFVRKFTNESLSAVLTIFCMLLIIAAPLYLLTQVTLNEAMGAYASYTGGKISIDPNVFISRLPEQLRPVALDLTTEATNRISSWVKDIALDAANIVSNVAGFFFSFFIVLFALYYFLKDRSQIAKFAKDVSPLPELQEKRLAEQTITAVNGVVRGNFLTALLQGTVAGVGFLMAGVSGPIFWGFATAISSLVPVIGTALVIVPIIIYLLLVKSVASALILAAWYTAMHLLIDSIIAPKMIGHQVQLHPLLVLLSVLGGLQFFGGLGFLFGPIIVAIAMALIDTYRSDIRRK